MFLILYVFMFSFSLSSGISRHLDGLDTAPFWFWMAGFWLVLSVIEVYHPTKFTTRDLDERPTNREQQQGGGGSAEGDPEADLRGRADRPRE